MCFVILAFLLFETGFHVAQISLDEPWCADQAGPEAHRVLPLFTECYQVFTPGFLHIHELHFLPELTSCQMEFYFSYWSICEGNLQ